MAVTVAMLERISRSGNGSPIMNGQGASELIFEDTFSTWGWPLSQQEICQADYYHSAPRAGNFTSINNMEGNFTSINNWEGTKRLSSAAITKSRGWPSAQQDVKQSNYSQWAAGEYWQQQRNALDSSIETFLKNMLPGSHAPAPALLLGHLNGQHIVDKKMHMPESPPSGLRQPPGLGCMLGQAEIDSQDSINKVSLGLGHEHQEFQHQSPTWNVVEDAPIGENVPLPAIASKAGSAKSTSSEANSEDSPEREGRRTLLIAYYPRGTTEECLQTLFETFGKVHIVNLVKDKLGLHMCYGFVRFAESSTAEKAYSACQTGRVIMHDSTGKAWHLKASWAKNAFGKKGKSGKRAKSHANVQPEA